ncbi:Hypothetical protein FKW44_014825, partial [Caligus rogercresseyi]
ILFTQCGPPILKGTGSDCLAQFAIKHFASPFSTVLIKKCPSQKSRPAAWPTQTIMGPP